MIKNVIIKKPSDIILNQMKKHHDYCYLTSDNMPDSVSCFLNYIDHIKMANKNLYMKIIGIMACDYYKYIKLLSLEANKEIITWFENDIDIDDILIKINEEQAFLRQIYKKSFFLCDMHLDDNKKYVLKKNVQRSGYSETLKSLNQFYSFEEAIDDYYIYMPIKDELINYFDLIYCMNLDDPDEYCRKYVENIKLNNKDDYDDIIKQILSEFYIWKKWNNLSIESSYIEQKLIRCIENSEYNEILLYIENDYNVMKILIGEFIWYNTKKMEVSIDTPLEYIRSINKNNVLDKFKTNSNQKKKTL
jgi:hypothetical protein